MSPSPGCRTDQMGAAILARSDWSLWSRANDMLLEHGASALMRARQRAAERQQAGDLHGCAEWRVIAQRIGKLLQAQNENRAP